MKQFFQLKSSFYFLKNVVFAIFCFILGYLLGSGIIDAKAEEIKTLDLTDAFNEFKAYNYEIWNQKTGEKISYKTELDRLISNLENLNVHYIITFSELRYRKLLQENGGSNAPTFNLYIANSSTVTIDQGYFEKEHFYYPYFYSNNPYFMGKNLALLSDYIEQNGSLPTESIKWEESPYSGGINRSSGNGTPFFTSLKSKDNRGSFVYATNVNLKFENKDYDVIKVGSNVYNKEIPVYSRLKNYGEIVYTENLRINSSNVDHIEYTFDFGDDNSPIHEFNFSTTWYSNVARLDLFNPPWLEYKKNDISYKLPFDLKRQATLDDVVYYDTQINQIMDIQELKFVVDFNNINQLNEGANSSVLIHFDSSLNFTRKIVYIGEEGSSSNYMTEVDFSNKYGVFVIPKVIQNGLESEVYSPLLYSGKELKINVYDTINTSVDPVKSYSDYNNLGKAWGNFNYLFRFNNKNQIVFFTNPNYLLDREPTKIRYDTRYFVHSICLSSESCEPIINPNTGEEINVIPPKNTGDGDDLDTIDKIYDSMDKFIDGAKEKSDYFNQLFDNFFKNMPNWVQSLCIFVFIMLQVFVILKIGGFGNGSD